MHIHSINYVIGILAAITIGIDCAINGFLYMTMAGGIYANTPLLVLCCLASCFLNGILYFQDIPKAFQNLYNDLQKPMSPITSKEFWTESILYLISTSSTITMVAFTYYAYASLPASIIVVPNIIIAIFCIAYVCGTFAIMKEALDDLAKQKYHLKVFEMFKERHANYDFYKFLIVTTITVAGCVFTQITVLKALHATMLLLAPSLDILTAPMFVLFLLSELAFTASAMLHLVQELDIRFLYSISGFFVVVTIILSAVCDAAITKASTSQYSWLTQSLGWILSAAVMLRYTEDFIVNYWRKCDHIQRNNIYNALFFIEHLAVMGISLYLISLTLIPSITPAVGTIGAFCIGVSLLSLIFIIDQTIDVYCSHAYIRDNDKRIPFILSTTNAQLFYNYACNINDSDAANKSMQKAL